MKNNFLLLTKINILGLLDFRNFKKTKAKAIPFLSFAIMMGFFFLLASTGYSVMFAFIMKEGDVPLINSTIIMAGIGSMLVLSSSASTVGSVFAGRDYEMLRSMPINNRTIVSSKLVSIYLVEFIFSFFVMFPNSIVNLLIGKDIIYFVVPFIMMFLLPVLPLTIGAILSILIAVLAGRSKIANIISTILYVAFFMLIMMTSFFIGQSASQEGMSTFFSYLNPSIRLILVTENVWLNILLFVLANGLLLIAVLTIMSLTYNKICELVNSNKSNYKYEQKTIKNKGELKTLYLSNIKKVFGSRGVLVQLVMGPLALALMLIFMSLTSFKELLNRQEVIDFMYIYLPIIVLTATMMVTMIVPSASLISLEGKQMWLIKSSPIDYKKLLLSKVLVSLTISLPSALIAIITLIVDFRPNLLCIIFTLVIGILMVVFMNMVGIIMNLLLPRFKYDNEVQVVKNSGAMLFTLLISFVSHLHIAGIMVALAFVNNILSYIIGAIIILIVIAILAIIINRKGPQMIEKMEDF